MPSYLRASPFYEARSDGIKNYVNHPFRHKLYPIANQTETGAIGEWCFLSNFKDEALYRSDIHPCERYRCCHRPTIDFSRSIVIELWEAQEPCNELLD